MNQKRVLVPSSQGYEVPVDVYVSHVCEELDPRVRRPAVVICPGGGYRFCSQREAEPVALRFVTLGFNAFVVWYRTEPNRYPLPQQDAAAAVAHVRAHAEAYHTDPDRIAVLGFSAGGHLAGSLGTLWHRGELWQELSLQPEDVRPNGMVLCYPVISGGEHAHRGSFEKLTGSDDLDLHVQYSVDGWVTDQCPPAFLWHTFDDQSVPVQNSLLMAQALTRHGVLTEMHIYPHGRHGLSLANEQTAHMGDPTQLQPECSGWPELAARFLRYAMK